MAASKVLLAYVVCDGLFVVMGAIMLAFSIVVGNELKKTPTDGNMAARNMLYADFPLTAGIVNSILYLVTFVFSIPAIVTPGARGWLKLNGYMITATSLCSLCIGLFLWISTLRTRDHLAAQWAVQPASVQDLLQTTFLCCGYINSTTPAFVRDATCPSPAAAALQRGCATPIASFANVFVDNIFTAVFGMAGIGALLIVATACLVKDRKERERFRHIDEKSASSGF